MRKTFGFVLVAVLALASSSACHNPNSPDGYNPNDPIDKDNVPVCTGNCTLATATFGVYEGDCVDDAAMCTREIFPTEDASLWVDGREKTYILTSYRQRYTLHFWVTHSGVPQRKVIMGLTAPLGASAGQGSGFFEKDIPSPVHIAASFNMTFPDGVSATTTGLGSVFFQENQWDLSLNPNSWEKKLGFRVVRP